MGPPRDVANLSRHERCGRRPLSHLLRAVAEADTCASAARSPSDRLPDMRVMVVFAAPKSPMLGASRPGVRPEMGGHAPFREITVAWPAFGSAGAPFAPALG